MWSLGALGRPSHLPRWRGWPGGAENEAGRAVRGKGLSSGGGVRQEPPSFHSPLPFPMEVAASDSIRVGSFGFSSIKVVELVMIKMKTETSSRLVRGQSMSPLPLPPTSCFLFPGAPLTLNPEKCPLGHGRASRGPLRGHPRLAFTEDDGGSP